MVESNRRNMFRPITFWFLIGLGVVTWMFWPGCGAAITSGTAAPDVAAESWLNSKPLTIGDLKGRVVLVECWTYG